jgi:hypothetical protein
MCGYGDSVANQLDGVAIIPQLLTRMVKLFKRPDNNTEASRPDARNIEYIGAVLVVTEQE